MLVRKVKEALFRKWILLIPLSLKKYFVTLDELIGPKVAATFENGKVFFQTLAYASEIIIQKDKNGIGEDAVSTVIPEATIYMPFAELVDIEKEIERLSKEEARLKKELARSEGMLSNEKFVSKAPASKIEEEKEKGKKWETFSCC